MGIIIAIDGPAGAGKSTVARRVAELLGFTYIDSGAMFRAVALWAVRQSVDPTDMHRMEQLAEAASITLSPNRVLLNNEDVTESIREPQVSEAASQVAVIAGVRRALLNKQREIAAQANVVMEGRDIGSVVFLDATLKIFLDADPGERVRRRVEQIGQDSAEATQEMAERDRRDRTRAEAPLTQAPDAIYLDSTDMNIDEVIEAILRLARQRLTNGKTPH
jgi:cytidylate kinase